MPTAGDLKTMTATSSPNPLVANIAALLLATAIGVVGFSAVIHFQGLDVQKVQTGPLFRGLLASVIITIIAPPTRFWWRVCALSAVYLIDLTLSAAMTAWLPIASANGFVSLMIEKRWQIALFVSATVGYSALIRLGENRSDSAIAAVDAISISANASLAGPWPRFWARLVDFFLLQLGLSFAFGVLTSIYAPALYLTVMGKFAPPFNLILVPITAVVLGCIMTMTGTTIGKSIVGVRVPLPDGERAAGYFFRREFRVLLAGLALGLPIFWPFTFTRQYHRLKAGKPASYDLDEAPVVGGSSRLRTVLGMLAVAVLVGIAAHLNSDTVRSDLELEDFRPWKNPITNRAAYIARTWKEGELPDGDGNVFYFNSDALFAELLLGYQRLDFDDVDRISYAHAIADVLAKEVVLTSLWAPVTVRGHAALRATGKSLTAANTTVEITIVIEGRNAWRTLMFARGRQTDEVPNKEFFINELIGTID
ncbi:hypothetical protein ATY78_13175 [Rhizobium sp. R635]|nr:hypothetical protein ATY78_13175 [Rhizobium sp. R635]